MDKKKIRCFFKKAILQFMARYLKENYDVIICGAGPAGLYAANCLQKASADQISVLLLDKKSPWKEPVACAEAVSRKIFSRYWTPKEEWTRQHLDGVYFTSPDMTRVEYFQADCGLILNRAAFHHEMADKAAELGVECHFEDVVEKLLKAENGLWALKIRSGEGESELHAKVVIDATGPGAKITRHVPGLEALESGDFDQEAAVFAIAEGIPHSRRHIELLFGNRFFAGGYGIYKEALPLADILYITEVELVIEDGDTFFPDFNKSLYEITVGESGGNDIKYNRIIYKRRPHVYK